MTLGNSVIIFGGHIGRVGNSNRIGKVIFIGFIILFPYNGPYYRIEPRN